MHLKNAYLESIFKTCNHSKAKINTESQHTFDLKNSQYRPIPLRIFKIKRKKFGFKCFTVYFFRSISKPMISTTVMMATTPAMIVVVTLPLIESKLIGDGEGDAAGASTTVVCVSAQLLP